MSDPGFFGNPKGFIQSEKCMLLTDAHNQVAGNQGAKNAASLQERKCCVRPILASSTKVLLPLDAKSMKVIKKGFEEKFVEWKVENSGR